MNLKELEKKLSDLNSCEYQIVAVLYLDIQYPHNFFTINDLVKLVNSSRRTITKNLHSLEIKGWLKTERSRVLFVYPVRSIEFSRGIRVVVKKRFKWR